MQLDVDMSPPAFSKLQKASLAGRQRTFGDQKVGEQDKAAGKKQDTLGKKKDIFHDPRSNIFDI